MSVSGRDPVKDRLIMRIGALMSRAALGFLACLVSSIAAAAGPRHYVVTNDDFLSFSVSGVTFYSVGADGLLELDQEVPTGGTGAGGGFFGTNRIAVPSSGVTGCVYVSAAFTGDILGIDVARREVRGTAYGSNTDNGANGIGLVLAPQYLYAGFTSSNTIGTFQLQSGCGLTFVNDVAVAGLRGGFIEGMAVYGNMLVATYGDGSIESFNISGGTPVSNGDRQISTAAVQTNYVSYPTSVEITADGHYALFGDTSTSTVVEVSDISSGKLTATVPYTLGRARNSSNILLSPDETLLYVSNSQGDSVTAAFFNSATGQISGGCVSGRLREYVSGWTYLGSLAVENDSGTGGVLYVAEFGQVSSIAMITVTSANGQCTLQESDSSPVSDPNSNSLLSIATVQ
jgi:6-phosphogluconolactonase (cycloisomerase 2 family)